MAKGTRALCGVSFIRALIPFVRAPSTLIDLSTSQRPQLLIPSTLGVRISTYKCWGDIGIQTMADSLNTLPDPRRRYDYHSTLPWRTLTLRNDLPKLPSWRVLESGSKPWQVASRYFTLAATLDAFLINAQPSAVGINLIL